MYWDLNILTLNTENATKRIISLIVYLVFVIALLLECLYVNTLIKKKIRVENLFKLVNITNNIQKEEIDIALQVKVKLENSMFL